jgi:hypothetical protein
MRMPIVETFDDGKALSEAGHEVAIVVGRLHELH